MFKAEIVKSREIQQVPKIKKIYLKIQVFAINQEIIQSIFNLYNLILQLKGIKHIWTF